MRQPDWKAALDIATVLGLLILLAVVAGSVLAAENPKVSVGKKMPLFQLNDTDGKAHSLASVKGKTAVLIFSSQKCPWSHAADKGLKTLAKEYSAKGVAFFAIDSNRSTSPEELKAYVAKEGIPYPVLKGRGEQVRRRGRGIPNARVLHRRQRTARWPITALTTTGKHRTKPVISTMSATHWKTSWQASRWRLRKCRHGAAGSNGSPRRLLERRPPLRRSPGGH